MHVPLLAHSVTVAAIILSEDSSMDTCRRRERGSEEERRARERERERESERERIDTNSNTFDTYIILFHLFSLVAVSFCYLLSKV